METLFSAPYVSESDWFDQPSQPTRWTKEENKLFESALAIYGESTPERWIKVAAMIPGKTVVDVIKQYRELEEDLCDIEAGKVPIPGYLGSPFTPSDCGGRDYDGSRKRAGSIVKDGVGGGGSGCEMERKKGVPWTEEEHKRFLMGLLKYGKGDWRNISRNFVISKTPTQVASHAQKYFIRQLSIGKDKRRPSIHDITTVNLSKTTTKTITSSESHQHPPPFDPSNAIQWHQRPDGIDELGMIFDSSQGNLFMPSSFEIASSGIKLQGYDNAYLEARIKHQSSVF